MLHDKIVENVHKKKAARIAEIAISLTEEEKFSTDKRINFSNTRLSDKLQKSFLFHLSNKKIVSVLMYSGEHLINRWVFFELKL